MCPPAADSRSQHRLNNEQLSADSPGCQQDVTSSRRELIAEAQPAIDRAMWQLRANTALNSLKIEAVDQAIGSTTQRDMTVGELVRDVLQAVSKHEPLIVNALTEHVNRELPRFTRTLSTQAACGARVRVRPRAAARPRSSHRGQPRQTRAGPKGDDPHPAGSNERRTRQGATP